MRLRKTLCGCMLLFFVLTSFAQVNLQTGSATFSLPMFNWKDNKSRLFAGVALNYSSGNGLKVNEVASNAGQGWSIASLGVITRMQVGEPDDQRAYGQPAEKDITKYPNGYLYAATPAGNGCPQALSRYPIYREMNQLYSQHNVVAEDKQMDYFTFQFNGKVGLFVVDMVNGNGVGQSLGDSKMKITFQTNPAMTSQGKRTTITSFQIHDVDGLIYKFTQHGLVKVLKDEYCDKENGRSITQPKFEDGNSYTQAAFDRGPSAAPWSNSFLANPWVISNWYLTEIEDALTHRKVNLTYNIYTINSSAGADITCYQPKDYTVITMKRSQTIDPRIATISFPDGHNVTFNYGSDRIDLPGDKVLGSVDIKYQSRYLSRYKLNTTYFILNRYGTPVTDYQKKAARLCLRSVTKLGVDLKEDSPPYLFDYYVGSGGNDCVPMPFSYAKDIWGFYNADNTKNYSGGNMALDKDPRQLSNNEAKGLCFLRSGSSAIVINPKNGYAKNGLLKQIIYPTGGTLAYEYEQNYGKLTTGGAEQMVGGVHVSKTLSTDGGYSNGCATPVTTKYDYVVNGAGSASSLWGLEMPVRSISSTNYYAPDSRYLKWSFSCITTCCDYRFRYPGILSLNQTISLTQFQQIMQDIAPVLGIVSLVSTIVDVVSLFCASTGWLAWVSVVVEVIGGVITLIFTCADQSETEDATTYFNTDLNSAAPLPAQFKRVEVTEGAGTIGKTVHEFTSSDDYAVWHGTNPSFASKQRFAPWAYGLPKLITVFDASGNRVKETRNIYNFNFARTALMCDPGDNTFTGSDVGKQKGDDNIVIEASSPCKVSTKCFVKRSYSQRNDFWANPSMYNATYIQAPGNADIVVDAYNFYTGRVLLDSVNERIYRQNSNTQYLETSVRYYYNSIVNYDINTIITTQSNGDKNTKTIKYARDYCCMPVSNAMSNANIVSVPVETKVWVARSGGTTGYLSETVTEFTQLGNGDIQPLRIMEQRFAQPVSSLTEYGGPGTSTANYKIIQTFLYDAAYNLAGLKDEGGRVVSNIYDYDDKYVVASVVNADPLTDKSAYTSFETTALGKWTLTGTPVYAAGSYATGARSFTLSSGKSLSTALTATRAYTVSFWASASTITVTGGATLSKSGPTYNGFTYYEYDIAAGTSTVTVSGTGNIDELRAYPKASRMRTVTYDPLIGKTSECDENNRVVYYEYDNLGRLRFIKDETRNIVKMYEYNNVSPAKQTGCPATFYSKLTSEVFYRNSCGANYLGGAVVFTIPANKYTSTVSQEDADLKAELDLLTNGQNYANANGTCKQVFYNTAQSGSFIPQTCTNGYKGQSVTYTVPANTYSSLVSVADANAKAQVEIAGNGQVHANKNPSCVIDNEAQWIWDEVNAYCLTVNGQLPARRFMLFKDMNPNSPTYNQTQWKDVGPQSTCPANTYFSAQRSQIFTRNNCGAGYTGGTVTYTVPPGKYNSTASQAAADQLAINDINANGQNYANTNGTCTGSSVNCAFYYSPSLIPGGFTEVISSGNTVSFNLSFSVTSSFSAGIVGNINGSACIPAGNRSVVVYESMAFPRTWQLVIGNNGDVHAVLTNGTPPDIGMGSSVTLVGSYTK
ncbi:MAG: hypothetical protein KF862_08715 [Chitinophagaceae bacterium]|nr:hypothetical protein [Chitinophagaceae bacterium]